MTVVELADRAMHDLIGINEYSVENFGAAVADQYLSDIESALLLLQEQPDILVSQQDVSKYFHFYPVRKHYLVCVKIEGIVLVLTIQHCQMDISERLFLLEQTLLQEAEILYERLLSR